MDHSAWGAVMVHLRIFAAIATLGMLCGFSTASADSPYTPYTGVLWRAEAKAFQVNTEPRTAQVGGFLFVQEFQAASRAILAQPLTSTIPGATRWNASPGDILSELPLTEISLRDVSGYCETRLALNSDSFVDGRKTRLCLIDRNRDGIFDTRYWANAVPGSDFTSMVLWLYNDHAISVPYVVQSGEESLFSAGPVVTRSALGAYRLEFAISSNGSPNVLQSRAPAREARANPNANAILNAATVYFRAADIPLTLQIAGAEVEIQRIENDVITYRLMSGFNSTLPAEIGFSTLNLR